MVLSQGATVVGRKRKKQSPKIRNTFAGKFGRRLERLVDDSGLTAREFGNKLGKSEDAVYHYFNGDRMPHMSDLPRMASVLGLGHVSELLKGL